MRITITSWQAYCLCRRYYAAWVEDFIRLYPIGVFIYFRDDKHYCISYQLQKTWDETYSIIEVLTNGMLTTCFDKLIAYNS
jgi:hypothetical protein